MNISDFKKTPGEEDETAVAHYEFKDPATGRLFNVRELSGPTSIEVVANRPSACGRGPRYFLEEYVPNGRLVREDDPTTECRIVPSAEWSRVRGVPALAFASVNRLAVENPGFSPVYCGSGFSVNTIFYATLEECVRAINNALDTDMWVVSFEPTKRVVVAPGVLATFEAKAMLNCAGGEQIMAALTEISEHLSARERAEVDEHAGGIRVDVIQDDLEYPHKLRLFLKFGLTGQVDRNSGFCRGSWAKLGNRVAGFELPRYDMPSGLACGDLPKYGQEFVAPMEQPEAIARIETLHKQDGQSDKVYIFAEVNGDWFFFAWGPFDGKKLQSKAAGYGHHRQMDAKQSRGYVPVPPDSIPNIWSRVLAVADVRRALPS